MSDLSDRDIYEAIKEMDEFYKEKYKKREKNIKYIFQQLSLHLTKYKIKKLKEYVFECGDCYNFELVKKYKIFGDKQDEGYWFKHAYINQYVGYFGDDYSGTIFVPIKENLFLKFEFEC